MIVTIHQPDFMPWLGFFDRWAKSDLYILLDDVQFIRRGWHHRDQIKTAQGPKWLTVPVVKKGRYEQLISDVEISEETDWRRKHLHAIDAAYSKAPNFRGVMDGLERIYATNHRKLIDLNIDLLSYFAELFKIDTPRKLSSSIRVQAVSSEKLAQLVKAVEGDVYLTGTGSKDYLDEAVFKSQGSKVRWQEYRHPEYTQLHGEFIPNLSALDYFMMAG